MVLKITVERENITEGEYTAAFTVHVDSHRILTVDTCYETILNKWLKQLLKSSTKRPAILVGISAATQSLNSWRFKNIDEQPYDFLCLNVGSHSLIYDDLCDVEPKSLISFFANPKVFAVGIDMAKICGKLKKHNGIEIRNAVDVNNLAVKAMKDDQVHLDLGRYGLDRLAMTVLGKHYDVVRPEVEVYLSDWRLTAEKVKFVTADAYLCYLIGLELSDAIDGAAGLKNKNKKNQKKNK